MKIRNVTILIAVISLLTSIALQVDWKSHEELDRIPTGMKILQESHILDLFEIAPVLNDAYELVGFLGKNPNTGLITNFGIILSHEKGCLMNKGRGAMGLKEDQLAGEILRSIPAFTDEWWDIMEKCGVRQPPHK